MVWSYTCADFTITVCENSYNYKESHFESWTDADMLVPQPGTAKSKCVTHVWTLLMPYNLFSNFNTNKLAIHTQD